MKRIYEQLKKRIFLSLLVVFFYSTGFSAVYYVSMTGNDANSGLSTSTPWRTLKKVNSTNFSPGDMILFKSGDRFYGQLVPTSSGTSSRLITYGSYGTGVKPLIGGFERLGGWKSEGGGVYSASSMAKQLPNIVYYNGVNTPMGRYPKTGWLTFESFSGTTSVTDNELGSNPNWTGGEIVIEKANWLIDRNVITSHSGKIINYSSATSYAPRVDGEYKYFIQNHRSTLTQEGDWYYKSGVFYMNFGTRDPNTVYVKVPWIETLVDINRKNYLIIDNITFEGANQTGIKTYLSADVRITNCDFSYMGDNAVYSTSSRQTTIENCAIKSCNGTGLYVNAVSSIIRNNVLSDIGNTPGMGSVTGDSYNGINFRGNGGLCEYNTVQNVGYNGIMFFNDYTTIRYNVVDGFCDFLFDGGGIYTYYGGSPSYVQQGMKVYGNIVMNGGGNGLYSDGLTNNLEIYNNSVANVDKWGVHMNQPRNNKVYNNNFINCGRCGMDISNLYNQEVMAANNSLYSNTVAQGNTSQLMMYLTDNREYNVANFGTSNSNYFIVGADGLDLFRQQVGLPRGKNTFYTYPAWKTFSKQESSSRYYIATLTDVKFYYNASKAAKVISLSAPMIDAKGARYSTSVTLQPYASVILMKDGLLKSATIPQDSTYKSLATGIDEIDSKITFDFYPNPSSGEVNIRFSQAPSDGAKIEIYDLLGRKVIDRVVANPVENFDLRGEPKGLYFLKSTIGVDKKVQKLIIK